MTTVWSWTYNPNNATISGNSIVLVKGMSNGGHATRTLSIPKNNPGLLVVSVGSNGNLDIPSGDVATGRAIVKVFNLTSVPSGGYNYVTGGYSAGHGLRNEVGIVFDGNNMWVVRPPGRLMLIILGFGELRTALTILSAR
jgi:glucose/arabinose dehydrogenase